MDFTPDQASLDSKAGIQSNGNTTGTDPSCRTDYVNVNKDVKVLFVVDNSGSNVNINGTDIDKKWRLATINKFIQTYQNKSNFYYGLITFQNSVATPQIRSGDVGIFTNNLSMVTQGVANFASTPDAGATPYQAAINLTKQMINEDLKLKSSKPTAYVVVMISDGYPSDSRYTETNGIANLKADTKTLVDMAPGMIGVNTVFLYNAVKPSSAGKEPLQAMAAVGGGTFIIADSNQTVSIADSIKVPQEICK